MTYTFTVESNPAKTASASPAHDEQGQGEGGGHEESGTVHLTPEQLKTAGIEVTRLALGNVTGTFTAPGEVMLNDYRTVKITPRIAAQIIERHARLGDIVEQDQPLVTLSSVEMAQAEGELLVADREWRRVKSLGRKVVSEKRYTEARVSRDQASAKVHAYGMSHDEITNLLDTKNKIAADGTFSLIATLKGRVLMDDFVVGERVEPGRVLMVIADESVMWVEARVRPADAARISSGNLATIQVGNRIFQAKVSQIHHTLDETTRTLAVRLDVKNDNDQLHPGMFVNVRIQTNTVIQALSVPESAVLRSPDGDWQVLVQQDEPGEFKAVEIEVKYVSDGKAVISGIEPGTPMVTQGAFFVQSELAKSGFEIHNH
ncbi:MAG TPA: efflux RND transporter periplasmic adaptor subunit [Gammaproteobacteria bacterium]|nr:efflux RND transporter periplasmic adaptor subunit [Gammaproteobacteria bacterium]